MKALTAVVLFLVSTGGGIGPVVAQNTPSSSPSAKEESAKKTPPAKRKARASDDDGKEPDINGMEVTRFDCELGNKLTIYSEAGNDQQIALRWKNRLHQMTRMNTTTGAHRFENAQIGLVWIGIPAKGMLLDAKKGRQLANECKSTAQRNAGEQRF
jgi:hypothetical protein